MRPLAITGVGAVTSLGESGCALLGALDEGRSGLGPAGDEVLAGAASPWAGRIGAFDPSPYIAPGRARRLDRASRFAVAAAHQALGAAGLAVGPALAEELGVVAATSSAGSGPLVVFLEALLRDSPDAAPPFEFPNTVANAPASHVSIELGLRGPNLTLSHSEAAIGLALLQGRLLLADGRCSALLAGAVDEWTPYHQLGYSQLGALRSRPQGGGGVLLAEGAVMMVVEAEEEAAGRGAPVLARVAGVAAGSAPGEPYRWVADPEALARVLGDALAAAGLGAEEVGSVLLAANGVEAMERAEEAALAEVFGGRRLVAGGVKGALGERAVSGAASVAVAALARHRGRLPPFAGGALGAGQRRHHLATTPTPLPPGATLVVLYGFGGNYAAVVLS